MDTTSTAPTLPDFYGKPINTPAGHRWAGYEAPHPSTCDCGECEQERQAWGPTAAQEEGWDAREDWINSDWR